MREESKGLADDYTEANQNSETTISKSQRIIAEPLNPIQPSSSIVQLPADTSVNRATALETRQTPESLVRLESFVVRKILDTDEKTRTAKKNYD